MTAEAARRPVRRPAPGVVRAAGWLVGVEGLLGVAFAVVLLVSRLGGTDQVGNLVAEAVFFLIMGLAVAAVGAGLVLGRGWARTPAIVVQLLLLPVVYSLLGPAEQIAAGVAAGAVVITALLLLINERAKVWSMDLHGGADDTADNQPPGASSAP